MAVALLCISIAFSACGDDDSSQTSTPSVAQSSSPTAAPGTPTSTPTAEPSPAPTVPLSIQPPERDLVDLAKRFRGLQGTPPEVLRSGPFGYEIGDADEFFVFELTGEPSIRTVRATLRHMTDHAYFFVEDGFGVSQANLDRIGSDFESLVYPTVRSAFGSEPTPGIDADERITLLHADLRGAGGYFSGGDQWPVEVVPHSNEREILYMDASILFAPGAPYNGLVAHEFQHMIHEYSDSGEESWVNEGLSQVAAQLVGAGNDWTYLFLGAPDTALLDWPELGSSSAVHYAASEVFFSYLLDHYGTRDNAKALLDEQADSIAGVRNYLDEFDAEFEDVFADWVIANYLDEASGPYSQPSLSTSIAVAESAGPGSGGSDDVGQFATDYFEVEGATFSFDGSDEATIGVPEHDGSFYWSQRGDGIDSRMTREFDLTGVDAATFRFDTWFAIENGWDFAYVAASTDGGDTWQALSGQQTTNYDPIGQSYGPGYTGQSGGWVQEEMDLSTYAGGKVLLRFEYVTDDSTNMTGFAVDNIEVPELGFTDNGSGMNGFGSEGFVRVEGPLTQEWIVQVLDLDSGQATRLDLDGQNAGTALLGRRSLITVSGITQWTSERASYQWSVSG